MAAEALDVGYLASYLQLPQETLTLLVDTPTTELVRQVLEVVTAQARKHDVLESDKMAVDAEFENAVRSSETRVEGLRSTIEKSQKTVEEVRTKLKEEGMPSSSIITYCLSANKLVQKIPGRGSNLSSRL